MSDAREQPHWDSYEEPIVSLNMNLFLKYTGFSFHDFADSHEVIPLGLVTPSPTHRLQGNDVLRYRFWIDLEQDMDYLSFTTRWY